MEDVGPLVRRLLAPNPSAFTYTGTLTHVIGRGEVAVIDPGPDIPSHIEALLDALRGERIAAIVCTHNHRDHTPGACLLKDATGAPIVGCAPLVMAGDDTDADEAFDWDYAPDRVLADGETLAGEGWSLEAVATPGHTSNHLCFAFRETGILFSGDHVMGWSTSIVSPPDGDMGAYRASLEKLLGRHDRVYLPAHGPAIEQPHDHVRRLIEHRKTREKQVISQLEAGSARISDMVRIIYADIDPGLHPAAERSVLAHLIDLERRGRVSRADDAWTLRP